MKDYGQYNFGGREKGNKKLCGRHAEAFEDVLFHERLVRHVEIPGFLLELIDDRDVKA